MKSIAQQRYVVSLLILAGAFLAMMCVGADTQLLGTGHGIDHVTIEVNNLDEAAKTFRDVFGFTPGPRHTPGQDGTLDLPILFNNWTYLELETVWDRQKAAVKSPNELRFLDRHEGAFAFCLETSSADTTAAWLRTRGQNVDGPSGGTWRPEGITKVFPEAMKYLDFKQRPVPGAPIWFTEYDYAVRQQIFDAIKRDPVHETHANGALKLHAVWIAVTNLQSAVRSYERLGLRPGRELNVPLLGAKAREIPAGTGTILLITPQGRDGMTTKSSDSPQWSPDSERLAFISDRSGKRNLWLIRPDGCEAERLTDVKTGVNAFKWSNDGKQIAFVAMDPPTEAEEKVRS